MTSRRLHRSSTDKMLSGVAGGLAEYFDVDPVLVRVGFVFLGFLTAFCAILLYIVLAIVMPRGVTTSTGTSDVTRDYPSSGAGEVNERGAGQSSITQDVDRGNSNLALALIAVGAIFFCCLILFSLVGGAFLAWVPVGLNFPSLTIPLETFLILLAILGVGIAILLNLKSRRAG